MTEPASPNDRESRLPLHGLCVVVTRSRAQASSLSVGLRRLGAEPIEVPMIAIEPPTDGGDALRRAVAELEKHEWVILTSPNGAAAYVSALSAMVDAPRSASMPSVAVIGPATGRVISDAGLTVDLVANRHVAEGLAESMPAADASTGRGSLLLPQAEETREVLVPALEAKGWNCAVVAAYRTVAAAISPETRRAIEAADAITFTSSSTVTHFCEVVGELSAPPIIACIGPITAETAAAHGLAVTVVAAEYTIDGLVEALLRAVRANRESLA